MFMIKQVKHEKYGFYFFETSFHFYVLNINSIGTHINPFATIFLSVDHLTLNFNKRHDKHVKNSNLNE